MITRNTPGVCVWPGCGPGLIWSRRCCRRHYEKMLRLGYLTGTMADPGPVRTRITAHLDRGRTLFNLSTRSGVALNTLRQIHRESTVRVRTVTARKIFAVPLPPSQIGTLRRLRALARIGYTAEAIAAELGIPRPTISAAVFRGWFSDQVSLQIADGYERLAHTPGKSRRAARYAELKGHRPPADWDDIDNPDEIPGLGLTCEPYDEVNVLRFMAGDLRLHNSTASRYPLGDSERLKAARDEAILRLSGHSAMWISQQIHCSERTVERVQAEHAAQRIAS